MRTAALLLLLGGLPAFAQFDILITGGKVIDGSGGPWFYADIGIKGDSIAAVGLLPNATAAVRLDARGLTVAPGFIDIHSHGRRGIFETPTAANYLHEGVTTLVVVRPVRAREQPMRAALAFHSPANPLQCCENPPWLTGGPVAHLES